MDGALCIGGEGRGREEGDLEISVHGRVANVLRQRTRTRGTVRAWPLLRLKNWNIWITYRADWISWGSGLKGDGGRIPLA